ncbi:MAG: phospho-N-acetylmuramoyl-pentapeptide-transferase [Christensenellales bacterium]
MTNGNLWMPLCVVFSFAAALCIAPILKKILTKGKVEQTVLGYVKQHENKTGTPTMGGWIFVIPAIVLPLIFYSTFSVVSSMATLSYAIVGFLDDFIKIHYKRNLGLKPYQKIIGQVGAAIILGFFCLNNASIGSSIKLPFTSAEFEMGWFIVPFVALVYIAVTNGVNLTDGLDGLAGFVSIAYFLSFSVILWGYYSDAVNSGNAEYAKELFGLCITSASFLGGLLGYVCFNSYPSSIMMGDTGSLALGAGTATVAIFSRQPFLIVFAGIMFVISCISVILQVAVFKIKKKRVFLMAPLHHHFELKGYKESKITACYFSISVIGGILAIIAARVL